MVPGIKRDPDLHSNPQKPTARRAGGGWTELSAVTEAASEEEEEDEEAKDRSRVEGEERFYPQNKAVRRAVVHRRSS